MDRYKLITKISEITENSDFNQIEEFIDAFFQAIKLGLIEDKKVDIDKWGTFFISKKEIEYNGDIFPNEMSNNINSGTTPQGPFIPPQIIPPQIKIGSGKTTRSGGHAGFTRNKP